MDLTLWEIVAYIDGHNRAQADRSKPDPMSNDEFDDLLARHNVKA